MSLSFVEGRTRLEFICGGAMDIRWLIHWLKNESEEDRSVTRQLGITDDDVQALPTSTIEISLCALHEIVGLLPGLQELHLTGLVFVSCDYIDHGDHILAPPAQQLSRMSLKHIATIFPFEVDPLRIIQLAPRLVELSLEGCYALRNAPDTHPSLILRRFPHAQLKPLHPFPPTFTSLRVVFPNRTQQDHYMMHRNWYEFMTRLPFARGTRSMVLENVHDGIAAAMATVIDNDAETLTSLTIEFMPRFQWSNPQIWADLSFRFCDNLKLVTFWLPVERVFGPDLSPTGAPRKLVFVGLHTLFLLLPPVVERIVLFMEMLDLAEEVVYDTIWAIRWAALDVHLDETLTRATLQVNLTGRWFGPITPQLRAAFAEIMPRTYSRGRLDLVPQGREERDILLSS